jgi:mycothiol synthase
LASSPPALPTGYAARAASYEDLAGIDELYAAADRALSVPVVPVSGDLRWRWSQPTFDIVRDTRVLVGDGHLVGFGMVSVPDDAPMIARVTARVHPAHTGRGLGSWLLRSLERSARDREGVSVCRQTYVPDRDAAGQRLLEAHGYRRVRATVDMGVALEPPIDVDPPDGVVIRPFEPGEERVAWRLEVDAFRDHWDHMQDQTFESFVRDWFQDQTLPSFVLLAELGDRPVGVLAWTVDQGVPYVFSVGVLREARGRGVGTALLRRAMSDAAAAGYREMTLSVDAASPTGAVHAYEKAGMTVRRGDLIYDKELR